MNWLLGRRWWLIVAGILAGMGFAVLCWAVSLPISNQPGWVKRISGVEIGLQLAIVLTLAGIAPRLAWLEQTSRRPSRWQTAVALLAVILSLTILPLAVCGMLRILPIQAFVVGQELLGEQDRTALFPVHLFVAFWSQMWWSLGWGLLATVLWRHASAISAVVSFVALVTLQQRQMLAFFPGGYQNDAITGDPLAFLISLLILISGLIAASSVQLGTAGVVERGGFTQICHAATTHLSAEL